MTIKIMSGLAVALCSFVALSLSGAPGWVVVLGALHILALYRILQEMSSRNN